MLTEGRFELLTVIPQIKSSYKHILAAQQQPQQIPNMLGNRIQDYTSTYVMYKINGNDLNMEENREIHITD